MCIVGREETSQDLAAFKQQQNFTFPVASDLNRELYGQYATWGIPRIYLIGSTGEIAYQTLGHDPAEISQIQRGIQLSLK